MPSESAIPVSTLENEELLPFAEKGYIDSRRARHILRVSAPALGRLAEMGCIRWMDNSKASWKRVNYQSIVGYCDHLRRQHRIPDRRPPLEAPYLRYRDVDLLPFPWSDTVTAQEAARALGYEKVDSVVTRIETGCFEAYQIVPGSNWRVSRSSLLRFIEGAERRVRGLPVFARHF
jgi:hypothetical protein